MVGRQLIAIIFLVTICILALPAAFAADCCYSSDPISAGCVDDQGETACDDMAGVWLDDISCSEVDACDIVCCCALSSAVIGPPWGGPQAWNDDPVASEMNRITCEEADQFGLDDYQPWPAVDACDVVCGSSTGGPGGTEEYVTVVGEVADGTSGDSLGDVLVYLPSSTGGYQTRTSTDTADLGRFELENVPKGLQGFVHAIKSGCVPWSSERKEFLDDPTIIPSAGNKIELNCDVDSCDPDGPTMDAVAVVPKTAHARFKLGVVDNCNLFQEFIVQRERIVEGTTEPCEGGCHFLHFAIDPSGVYYDDGSSGQPPLEPNSQYAYRVVGDFGIKGTFPDWSEATPMPLETGDAECMQEHDREWCDNGPTPSLKMSCDPTRNVLVSTACVDNDMLCLKEGVGDTANAECFKELTCAACNGVFGMLGNIPSLIFGVLVSGETQDCDSSYVMERCFEDRTVSVFDGMRSCGEVVSCEDYLSSEQCGANPCGIVSECVWTTVGGLDELGTGFCRSKDLPARCDECANRFGVCNKELCEAIGVRDGDVSECYWETTANGYGYDDPSWGIEIPRCVHMSDVSCATYDDEESCTGGVSPEIDVTYATSGNQHILPRQSPGTNEITIASEDRYHIGSCEWNPAGNGRCYKNRDGFVSDANSPRDDCSDYADSRVMDNYGPECYGDNESPVTSFTISEQVMGLHQLQQASISVSDNLFRNEEPYISTRFCAEPYIDGQPANCYPIMTKDELIQYLNDFLDDPDEPGESGDPMAMVIRYYSYDGAQNLESIQEKQVTLMDMGVPLIFEADIR